MPGSQNSWVVTSQHVSTSDLQSTDVLKRDTEIKSPGLYGAKNMRILYIIENNIPDYIKYTLKIIMAIAL